MNKERYNQFSTNPSWFERFTWNGIFNNSSRPDLNVLKFIKNENPFKVIKTNNVNNFWKIINKIGEKYSNWCASIDMGLNEEEKNALKLFFIGCIGEYFFFKLFENHNTLLINNKLYTFSYVCPRLNGETDYGVDLTGNVSSNTNESWDCVFQVKFWNPYNGNFQMTYDILSRVYTDAIINDFIDKNNNETIFVCWLNDDNQVSKALRNSPIWHKITFIGKKELNNNINNQVPEFWNMFIEDLNNLL